MEKVDALVSSRSIPLKAPLWRLPSLLKIRSHSLSRGNRSRCSYTSRKLIDVRKMELQISSPICSWKTSRQVQQTSSCIACLPSTERLCLLKYSATKQVKNLKTVDSSASKSQRMPNVHWRLWIKPAYPMDLSFWWANTFLRERMNWSTTVNSQHLSNKIWRKTSTRTSSLRIYLLIWPNKSLRKLLRNTDLLCQSSSDATPT